jgi:pimeloyl-ACP methyl ester carboxylesterase
MIRKYTSRGASVAMRLAADHPRRTRSLGVVGGPVVPVNIENLSMANC